MHIYNMEELKENAILITEKTQFHNTVSGKTTTLNPNWITPSYSKRYACENGVISFIDERMNWYAVPCLEGACTVLENLGYIKAGFYVPCSDKYSYPVKEKEKWESLLKV